MAFDLTGVGLSTIISKDLSKYTSSSTSTIDYWKLISSDILSYIQNYFPSTFPSDQFVMNGTSNFNGNVTISGTIGTDTLRVNGNVAATSFSGNGAALTGITASAVVTRTETTYTYSSAFTSAFTIVCNPSAIQTIDISIGAAATNANYTLTFVNPSLFTSTIVLKTGIYYTLNTGQSLMVTWDNTQWEIINSPSGAAIGNWTSYTPTLSNITVGAGAVTLFKWRRVGSNMEILGFIRLGNSPSIASSPIVSMPSGYTADESNFAPFGRYGDAEYYDATASSMFQGTTLYHTSLNGLYFFFNDNVAWSSTSPADPAVDDEISFRCSVPIQGWGSSINLVSDFQEFASNNNAGVAANTVYNTGMVSGPNGSPILSVVSNDNTSYHTTRYNVMFSTAIKQTDRIILEVLSNYNGWMDVSGIDFRLLYGGTAAYGIGLALTPIDSYTIQVLFGNSGVYPTSATYGQISANAWSALAGDRWRVRKISNGNFAQASPNVNVIQPITSIQSTGFTYTIPLIPLQTSIVYIPVACAKSSGSAFNITISNGTSSVLINIPASSPTPTVSAITSTLFCDSSGILTLQGDITSSGSNSNGSWIQFADGTMFCTGDNSGPLTTNTAIGPWFYNTGTVTFTFPIPFVVAPQVWGAGVGTYFGYTAVQTTVTPLATLSGLACSSSVVGVVYPRYAAWGRWR